MPLIHVPVSNASPLRKVQRAYIGDTRIAKAQIAWKIRTLLAQPSHHAIALLPATIFSKSRSRSRAWAPSGWLSRREASYDARSQDCMFCSTTTGFCAGFGSRICCLYCGSLLHERSLESALKDDWDSEIVRSSAKSSLSEEHG